NSRRLLRWQTTGSPTSAVAEEKLGSSRVQRRSVPAGTTMFWALAPAAPHKNTTRKIKPAKSLRIVLPPDLQAGQHKPKPRGRKEKRKWKSEVSTARTHLDISPRA